MEHGKNLYPRAIQGPRPCTAREAAGTRLASTQLEPFPNLREYPAARANGWTHDRVRVFLDTLAECGVVTDAVRAAGMTKQSAYALRNSARGRSFDVAWRAAQLLARRRLSDEVMSRALNGCVEVIVRDGQVWGERHRYDNRLTMQVLARLDQLAESTHQLDDAPRRVAHEFEAYVDALCDGEAAAAAFVRKRGALPYKAFAEAEIITRNAEYQRPEGEEPDEQHADAPESAPETAEQPAEAPADTPTGTASRDPDDRQGTVNLVNYACFLGSERPPEPPRSTADPWAAAHLPPTPTKN